MLLSNNRKRATVAQNCEDKSQIHCAERKEPETKVYIMYDFISYVTPMILYFFYPKASIGDTAQRKGK